MNIKKFTFNPFQENTYVLYTDSKEAMIVDPGCSNATEERELMDFIESEELKVSRLLCTHAHLDHIFGALILSEQYSLPFEVPENDLSTFRQASQSAAMFGLSGFEVPEPQPGLKEGKDQLGAVSFDILLTPGHSVGHVVFVFHEKKWVIGGDVLFQGSIGRTDLPGGDFDTLERSIKNKLYPLPDDYTVYCGHGPETTIGWEKKNNPFVRA